MEKETGDKMALWGAVETTDPKYTKTFSRGGGFTGTAINPTYLVKKATSLWGAVGKGWGYTIVDERYIDGAPIVINDAVLCKEVIHVVRMELWFMDGTERVTCPQQFGQTTFIGKNKYGVFTDEEAPKKSVTDGLTKCLVLLGFGADIHMGLYDNSKYVNDLKNTSQKSDKAKSSNVNVPNEKSGKLWELLRRAEMAGNKTDFDTKFLADMQKRYADTGEGTSISAKQLACLEKIADRPPAKTAQITLPENDTPEVPAYLNELDDSQPY